MPCALGTGLLEIEMDLGRGFGDGAFFGVDFFFCALLAFQVARSARVQFSLGSYSCVSGVANERGGGCYPSWFVRFAGVWIGAGPRDEIFVAFLVEDL